MKEKEEILQQSTQAEKPNLKRLMQKNAQNTVKKNSASHFSSSTFFFDSKRFTYTFLSEGEVASIHFDLERQEIFYKGHNIRNMLLNEKQTLFLKELIPLLIQKNQRALAENYESCLMKVLNS